MLGKQIFQSQQTYNTKFQKCFSSKLKCKRVIAAILTLSDINFLLRYCKLIVEVFGSHYKHNNGIIH